MLEPLSVGDGERDGPAMGPDGSASSMKPRPSGREDDGSVVAGMVLLQINVPVRERGPVRGRHRRGVEKVYE
jgi:hypothetical protein